MIPVPDLPGSLAKNTIGSQKERKKKREIVRKFDG